MRNEYQSRQTTDGTQKGNPPARSFLSAILRVKTNESWPSLFPREAPAKPAGDDRVTSCFCLPGLGVEDPGLVGSTGEGSPNSGTAGPAGGAGRLVCSPQNSESLLGGKGAEGCGPEERKLHLPGCRVRSGEGCRCRQVRRPSISPHRPPRLPLLWGPRKDRVDWRRSALLELHPAVHPACAPC